MEAIPRVCEPRAMGEDWESRGCPQCLVWTHHSSVHSSEGGFAAMLVAHLCAR